MRARAFACLPACLPACLLYEVVVLVGVAAAVLLSPLLHGVYMSIYIYIYAAWHEVQCVQSGSNGSRYSINYMYVCIHRGKIDLIKMELHT